jgi:hypothetical protein
LTFWRIVSADAAPRLYAHSMEQCGKFDRVVSVL